MKVKEVRYSMLRVTAQYENDRAEIAVEVEPKDDLDKVVTDVKAMCLAALLTGTEVAEIRKPTFTSLLKTIQCK